MDRTWSRITNRGTHASARFFISHSLLARRGSYSLESGVHVYDHGCHIRIRWCSRSPSLGLTTSKLNEGWHRGERGWAIWRGCPHSPRASSGPVYTLVAQAIFLGISTQQGPLPVASRGNELVGLLAVDLLPMETQTTPTDTIHI